MIAGLRRLLTPSATPLPPGPRGRILFVGPFHGGVGGVERITKCFADWARTSGYSTTMVVRNDIAAGPYTIRQDDRVKIVQEDAWGRELQTAAYDYVYIIGPGLKRRLWLPRLRRIQGVRVLLDLDRKRKWIDVADVLHCEAPREAPLPGPHVVATPDPFSTMPAVEPQPAGDFYLTAFNPYGGIKGHQYIEPFCEASDRTLIWCFDTSTWSNRESKYRDLCEHNIDSVEHERLIKVASPTREELYDLYARCAGYVCFSEDESLGFSMLDAVALGKPLCARRIGLCRGLEDFQATEDFGAPKFGTYALPALLGYGSLFEQIPALLGPSGDAPTA
ncbi:MAG: hypothetical protein P1V36_12800 [Planctomycetota bacterium]|nr:hypothetical protein [Planctomycetota bacterium]